MNDDLLLIKMAARNSEFEFEWIDGIPHAGLGRKWDPVNDRTDCERLKQRLGIQVEVSKESISARRDHDGECVALMCATISRCDDREQAERFMIVQVAAAEGTHDRERERARYLAECGKA